MPATTSLEQNREWLHQQNLSQFAGQWVCVVSREIVAAGADVRQVYAEFCRKKGADAVPFVTFVPEGHVTV